MQISETEILGAVKIKDGLYIGDEFAAQDLEFIVTNKVTHIINCAGRQLPNHWEPIGVVYLTLNWMETDNQILFDAKDEVINELFKFIDNAQSKAEGVLVHSVKGQNRSCCVLAAYFMRKYRWTLYKTLEFLHSRKPNLEIRSNFFSQLMALEAKFAKQGFGPKTYNWNEVGDDPKNMDSEELLLTNTFLNSRKAPLADFSSAPGKENKTTKLGWADLASGAPGADMKSKLITLINTGPGLKKDKNSSSCSSLRSESGKIYVKSILKGSNKVMYLGEAEDNTKSNQKTLETTSTLNNESKLGSGQKKLEGSQNTKEHKTSMTKSNSVSVLDRTPASTNIQGNIIHITVNNFITNNANGAAQDANSRPSTEDKSKRRGLAMSASSKDFNSLLKPSKESEKTLNPAKKRGYSPSTSTLNEKARHPRPNFSATFSGESKEDNNPIFATKIKVNNFMNEPKKSNTSNSFTSSGLSLNTLKNTSYKSYGTTSIINQKSASSTAQDRRPIELKENNRINERPQSFSNSGSNFFKYMPPSRNTPIRANKEIVNPNKRTEPYEAPLYAAGPSYNPRPVTVPDNAKQKKLYEESPYSAGYNPRPRNFESSSTMRQGSLQPQKENSKAPSANSSVKLNSTAKARLRSQSPGNSTMTLSYFQEMLNKPKWKY